MGPIDVNYGRAYWVARTSPPLSIIAAKTFFTLNLGVTDVHSIATGPPGVLVLTGGATGTPDGLIKMGVTPSVLAIYDVTPAVAVLSGTLIATVGNIYGTNIAPRAAWCPAGVTDAGAMGVTAGNILLVTTPTNTTTGAITVVWSSWGFVHI